MIACGASYVYGGMGVCCTRSRRIKVLTQTDGQQNASGLPQFEPSVSGRIWDRIIAIVPVAGKRDNCPSGLSRVIREGEAANLVADSTS
jgi:hypothetical protein